MRGYPKIRRETKNNIPKLAIIFFLIKANFLRNNELFKKNCTNLATKGFYTD
jgi:hypothetical protein